MIPYLLDQHAVDSAMTWLRRRNATHAPHYNLKDLIKLDGKLEAYVDGLRVAGEPGWNVAAEAMGSGEPEDLFPAALLAFESGKAERIQAVLDAAEEAPETLPGLASALAWMPFGSVEGHLRRLLDSPSIIQRRASLTAFALHRQDPGPSLQAALSDADPALQARALRAAGELGRRDLLGQLRNAFGAADEACRFWARWSAVLLGDFYSAEGLKAFVTPASPFQERALRVVMRGLDHQAALAFQQELAYNPATQRLATQAAGILGDPALIPWIQNQFAVSQNARVAGEAFTMITGVDLAYDDLEMTAPDDFESGPNDDPDDENVDLDADEDLPWPHPPLIQDWWAKHQGRFPAGTRHLAGKPIDVANLLEVLRTGTQRQRSRAALELSMLQPGTPLPNAAAPGFRQLQTLAQPLSGPVPLATEEDWHDVMMRGIREEEEERARRPKSWWKH